MESEYARAAAVVIEARAGRQTFGSQPKVGVRTIKQPRCWPGYGNEDCRL